MIPFSEREQNHQEFDKETILQKLLIVAMLKEQASPLHATRQ